MTNVPRNGIIELDADVYYSDPCLVPSLSQSTASRQIGQSPMHAHAYHPRFCGARRRPSKSMDAGTITHRLVLGAGRDFVEIDATDFRKKSAQEERDAAEAAGKIPILKFQMRDALDAANRILSQLKNTFGVELSGKSEQCCFWVDHTTDGAEVLCRGMLDHIIMDGSSARIIDLKTTRSAKEEAVVRSIDTYGYDIQAAAYIRAVETIYPHLCGRVQYHWIFAESFFPYATTYDTPSGEMLALGGSKWQRAVDSWEKCLRTNTWPAYSTETRRLSPRPYAVASEFEKLGTADVPFGDEENSEAAQ